MMFQPSKVWQQVMNTVIVNAARICELLQQCCSKYKDMLQRNLLRAFASPSCVIVDRVLVSNLAQSLLLSY